MVRSAVKALARNVGLDVFKASGQWRWSHTVSDYYPVAPQPRWGHGRPPHPELADALGARRDIYAAALDGFLRHKDILHAVPLDADPAQPSAPYWRNTWFTALDAMALVCFLLERNPTRFIEIGSGNSTAFARFAIGRGLLRTEITAIDPAPRREIDSICSRVVKSTLETVDLSIFDELEPGDILSFDGSHRCFTNSDVTVFFFEVMPRLKPGILVHIHDIFLPEDYPAAWNQRLYSEQYVLAAMLMGGSVGWKTMLPVFFASRDDGLRRQAEALAVKDGNTYVPTRYPVDFPLPGSSFWLETESRTP